MTAALPAGLVYRPDFLAFDEEGALLELLDALEFEPIVMRGVTARRTALRYGDEVPNWLAPLRDRGAALAGLEPQALAQALVQRYPPGAPIGWHRDYATYDAVVGISLGADARMRFRRGDAQSEILLERRSAYVLAGEARWEWEHHVPPVKELRYSVTFRSVRRRSARP
ncbi:MAG TPA: alpha-ketoglutarate-dependent dioxygenase AlkB [Gaiellaceae bacterium]